MKTFVSPEAISPDLVKKIRDLHRKILTLPEMMRAFSGKREGTETSPIPISFRSAYHEAPSSPSQPGSRRLPSLKASLSDPTLPRETIPLRIPSPQEWARQSQEGEDVISFTAEATFLLSLSSHCSQGTLPVYLFITNKLFICNKN